MNLAMQLGSRSAGVSAEIETEIGRERKLDRCWEEELMGTKQDGLGVGVRVRVRARTRTRTRGVNADDWFARSGGFLTLTLVMYLCC
jgi:hypothetical protein